MVLPKGTNLDIGTVPLAVIEDNLNTMPRRLHGWETAHTVYTALTNNTLLELVNPRVIGKRCTHRVSWKILAEDTRVDQETVLNTSSILTGSIPVIDTATSEELNQSEIHA